MTIGIDIGVLYTKLS